MIYDFVRFLSGPYLRSVIDFYIANQTIFNTIVVVLGFGWICYKRFIKGETKTQQKGFFEF